jgi:ADP-ribosyl-[dinitrogen reductase] hydrolase
MINSDKVKGSLIGACAGEALGATVEFMSAAEIKAQYGVLKDIIGGGVFGWETGEATDDIDMLFAVAKSLMELKTLDPADIAKKLVDWYNTNPKDIGGTTRMSLSNLWRGIPWDKASDPNNQYGAGNGSIVRCTPVILAYADKPLDECVDACDKTGLITHAHPLARWSVRFYATLLHRILNEQKGVAIADATAMANSFTPAHGGTQYNFEIKSNPTGFACDALATALFCLKQTSTLEDAVIMTVNLGGDTDSIAAVTGAIGGAIYGESAIPVRWVEKLKLSSIGMSIKFDGMIQRKEIHG